MSCLIVGGWIHQSYFVIHQGIPHLIRELIIQQSSRNDDNSISKEAFSWRGFDGERLNLKENLKELLSKKEVGYKNYPRCPQEIHWEMEWMELKALSRPVRKNAEVNQLKRKRVISLSVSSASVAFLFFSIHTLSNKHLYIEQTIYYYICIYHIHTCAYTATYIYKSIIITLHQQKNLKAG